MRTENKATQLAVDIAEALVGSHGYIVGAIVFILGEDGFMHMGRRATADAEWMIEDIATIVREHTASAGAKA